MKKYAIRHIDNGTVHYLVMFGYDGGKWCIQFSSGDLFRPVTLFDQHSAYTLVNLIVAMHSWYSGSLDVEEVDSDA